MCCTGNVVGVTNAAPLLAAGLVSMCNALTFNVLACTPLQQCGKGWWSGGEESVVGSFLLVLLILPFLYFLIFLYLFLLRSTTLPPLH